MGKLAFMLITCTIASTAIGLASYYALGYWNARYERKMQADEEQYEDILASWDKLLTTNERKQDAVVDLQWLQQTGFVETSANRWVN